MPEQEEGLLNKIETRRGFLKDVGKIGGALVAEEVARKLGMGIGTAEAARPEAGKEPQLDLPKGTYLTSQADWLLGLKGVTKETLEKLNGPKKYWGLEEMGGVLLAPISAFGNKEGADQGAKEKLRDKLIFRIDSRVDKSSGYGFTDQELLLMQTVLPIAARRCRKFFGKPWRDGLMIISKPGLERKERIKSSSEEAATFGGAMVGSETTPGTQEIVVFTDFEEYLKQNPTINIEKAFLIYATQINEFLPHEMGHAYIQDLKLGKKLNNHNIVRVAGISANIIDLIGKSPKETSQEITNRGGMHTDLAGPEMLLWKLFKVRGIEFFARLINALVKQYDDQENEFSEDRVSIAANSLFREAGFDFTYEDMLTSIDQKPENGKVQIRSMDGYSYPVEKVAGDADNPEGAVSWWVEVKTLAPAPIMPSGWSRQAGDIFPDKEGYYSTYKFVGNGKFKDGPPSDNSAAVASWMKGGSLSGGEVMFPVGMVGMELIRAVPKR